MRRCWETDSEGEDIWWGEMGHGRGQGGDINVGSGGMTWERPVQ